MDAPLYDLSARLKRDESEAPTYSIVDRPCRAVGRIHSAYDVETARDGEAFLRVGEGDLNGVSSTTRTLISFEERNQLPEDS